MLTMNQWVKANIGKGIDYDKTYGVQCVDLAKHFIKNVLGVEPQSIGNAIEYYNKRKTSKYLKDNFKWIDNTPEFIPQKGDLCVFTSKTGNGHISIATGEGTTKYFYSYDQNYPKSQHEPMAKIKHTYGSFLGVLRPKNQENIVDKVYAYTVTRLNAYSTTKYVNPIVIEKGEKVEIINDNVGTMTKNGVKYKMASIKYKGKTYYVAVKYLK